MKPLLSIIAMMSVAGWAGAGRAQLAMETNGAPERVFQGPGRTIPVIFHNPDNQNVESEIRTRVYQATSSTTVLVAERPWKKLELLPRQTVLESTPLDFPIVRGETTFLVQWLEGAGRVIGRTEVVVYPTNLLKELKPLAGESPVGIYDPQDRIKPLLEKLKLDFEDLENSSLEDFSGRLAIIGPFQSKSQMHEGLVDRVRALARKGTAVVWLQPPPGKRDRLQPSFYSVPINNGAVVVVQPEVVADLPDNPKSQSNLIYLCRLALHPEPNHLPNPNSEP